MKLPTGTPIAVRIAKVIDPSMNMDLYADKPYAMSPLISAVSTLAIEPIPKSLPSTPPASPQKEVNADLSSTTSLSTNATIINPISTPNLSNTSSTTSTSTMIPSGIPLTPNEELPFSNNMTTSSISNPTVIKCSSSTDKKPSLIISTPGAPQPLELPPWRWGGRIELEENTYPYIMDSKRQGKPLTGDERKSWALKQSNRESWQYTTDNCYCVDFYNRYLDIAGWKIKLPGWSLELADYWVS